MGVLVEAAAGGTERGKWGEESVAGRREMEEARGQMKAIALRNGCGSR